MRMQNITISITIIILITHLQIIKSIFSNIKVNKIKLVFFEDIVLNSEQNDECIYFTMMCGLVCVLHNLSK